MKKKLLPICAMALLAVGYSSVASADTGTVTKEDAAQVQQDKAKKEEAIKIQQKGEEEKKRIAQEQQKGEEEKKRIAQEQLKNDKAKKEAAQVQQKNTATKKEVAKPVVQGEKLPNTASNNVAMMALSACFVGVGTLFGLNRRNKVKA
ncbi:MULTISPECIES: LPXTG cell wall anchor domain-containing protein [Bacillus cereus group]|uniref:LPXTG cell wall anchor domain-containing protein n=1 Tax=Bacillus cereus group TaxID=86661 RepID=UPI000BE4A268|nr:MULTISPECIES: LPXTG cell wall anchor domain-containing protein [Bacillus cereus group]ATI49982.1 cell surface protein [Bacillus cereus]MBL3755379.1 LPXTG cell wall anchor domain-containing protein [Bacillus cereus]MDA2143661.1 LPXTG cell wall anchor domain-containing protein [Bacillus cereus group sp. Bc248]MDA2171597.1 LPXTG cell wall anchor domain-containing protein [Bacillus cereus group sp. Bc247]MDA2289447.1 LPXTG cell wall anchor domain-containing protein [Bacillus cereus group sp. Bc